MCAVFGCGPPRLNYRVKHINRMSKDMEHVELTHIDGSDFVAVASGSLKGVGGSSGHSRIPEELPKEALLKWTDGEGVSRKRILKLRDAVVGKLDLTSGEGEIHICFNEDGTISVVLVHRNRRALNYDESETVIAEYTQDEISYPAP
ncbi:hypothetical protein Psta_1410 [Pirellula staleyi DSM 6068]|uniref:Uncharacterized protein n=1 Tax=Pirellula staleyi (strain ATCC 27377 / DSM 6068 / ICPB 4128) TaxID=530564 RepID=D2QWY2_PIRSD|nr:hypothetical protein Psta_1410 [Pirellula staleyi DSM 6068]